MSLPESKFIRRPQLELVLKHLADRPRDRLLVLLAAGCGLRVTEAVCVKIEHLKDLGKGWIWVASAKKRPKDGKRPLERLPVAAQIAQEARSLARKTLGPYLFPGRSGGHLGERQAFYIFSQACIACKLGHKSFHALRHYRGFTVQDARGDLTITQKMLRHNSVRSTQVYTQRTPDEEKKLAEEIGW